MNIIKKVISIIVIVLAILGLFIVGKKAYNKIQEIKSNTQNKKETDDTLGV